MKKFILALVAVAIVGLGVPLASSTSADARHYRGHKKVVVIKRHHDRGHHYGWYKKRHHHHRGATVVVR
jgi:hypothetical protein